MYDWSCSVSKGEYSSKTVRSQRMQDVLEGEFWASISKKSIFRLYQPVPSIAYSSSA